MSTVRALAILCATSAVLIAGAAPARADGFISPFIGFNFGGDSSNCASLTSCEEKRLNWGASLGTVNGVFGFEEEIGYASQFFGKTTGGDNALLTLMSNLMLVVPAGPVQVYGLVGLSLVRPHMTFDSGALTLSKNAIGYDIGGGLNIFFTHGVGLRGDVRHIKTLQNFTLGVFNSDQINFWRGSVGLTFRF